ncbi:MAG: T9SS type A sorting domain-containing protein [Candidatus Cloacimonetes bacterium]|nr:T9SS type A sorting domain-containing protein [Candidatus Cloacimonadota bacterium]
MKFLAIVIMFFLLTFLGAETILQAQYPREQRILAVNGVPNRELVALFSDDFEDGGHDWEFLDTSGAGNLWHAYEDPNPPSGDFAVGCFDDESLTYLPGMNNYMITPEVWLPEDTEISWDVMLRMSLDNSTFPDCDYLMIEVRSQLPGETWTNWNYISNPLNEPGGMNCVFVGTVLSWDNFSSLWGPTFCDLSVLSGRNIQMRFGLHTNGYNQPVPGNIKLDDFGIYGDIVLQAAPLNLLAQTTDNNEVLLTWDAIENGDESGLFSHAFGNRREVTGYNIWRSGTSGSGYDMIGSILPSDEPSYLDTIPLVDAWNYYVVTALYDGIDGELSEESAAYVFGEDNLEMCYDDGEADDGIYAGLAQYTCVRFTPSYIGQFQLTHIRLYFVSLGTGACIIRIFPDEEGLPGEHLAQFHEYPSNLTTGWNTIPVPEEDLPYCCFNNEVFYVGIFELADPSILGLDTDNSGQSLITYTYLWEELETGNFMIRAIVNYPNGMSGYGDIDANGQVEAYDAALVLMHAVGMLTPFEPFPIERADVDGSGDVSAYDAALILQYAVGIITEFPVELRQVRAPWAELDCFYENGNLIISARGELYSATLEFPFALNEELLRVHPDLMFRTNRNRIAMAAATPVKGEILRFPVGESEIRNVVISATVNGVSCRLRLSGASEIVTLESAYPNPFNPAVTISYALFEPGNIRIDVYNTKGQKVDSLINEAKAEGNYQTVWTADDFASGIYFILMECNGVRIEEKVLLIK